MLVEPPAHASVGFGAAAELGHAGVPGVLRLGASAWIADAAAGVALSGTELSALWLLRSHPLAGGLRLIGGFGPALATVAGAAAGDRALAAAGVTAGVRLPLAVHNALALDLRATGLLLAHHSAQRSLRLGLRFEPGMPGPLVRGEPTPPRVIMAQLAPPPPDLAGLAGASGGFLGPGPARGDLDLRPEAFDSTGTALLPAASERLSRVGSALRRLGADPLWIIIYDGQGGRAGDVAASRRAVAVARALARGGYPAPRIHLEVAAGPGTAGAAGRLIAGRDCLNGCDASVKRPR